MRTGEKDHGKYLVYADFTGRKEHSKYDNTTRDKLFTIFESATATIKQRRSVWHTADLNYPDKESITFVN